MEGFDFSKMLKGLKDTIQINDGPDEQSLDVLIKGVKGSLDNAQMGMPNLNDKESMKQMLGMAGLSEKDIDFEIEPIEGGMRYRFSSKDAKEKMKNLMSQLFQGDMLQKLLEGLMGAFSSLGSDIGNALEDIGSGLGEGGDTPSDTPAKTKRENKGKRIKVE